MREPAGTAAAAEAVPLSVLDLVAINTYRSLRSPCLSGCTRPKVIRSESPIILMSTREGCVLQSWPGRAPWLGAFGDDAAAAFPKVIDVATNAPFSTSLHRRLARGQGSLPRRRHGACFASSLDPGLISGAGFCARVGGHSGVRLRQWRLARWCQGARSLGISGRPLDARAASVGLARSRPCGVVKVGPLSCRRQGPAGRRLGQDSRSRPCGEGSQRKGGHCMFDRHGRLHLKKPASRGALSKPCEAIPDAEIPPKRPKSHWAIAQASRT
jgi:hypothetical protein